MPSDSESDSHVEDETVEVFSPKAAELYTRELMLEGPVETKTSHNPSYPKNNGANTSYNKWKSKNNHLYSTSIDEDLGSMKSSLGKKLESSPNKMLNYTDSGRVRETASSSGTGYDVLFKNGKSRQVHFNRSLPLTSETNSKEEPRTRYSSPGNKDLYRERNRQESYSPPPERYYPPKNDYYGEHTCRYYGNNSYPSQSYHRPPIPDTCHTCHTCFERPKEDNAKVKSLEAKLKNNDKSVKNLYRIIWLQNEQLSLLQKQINQLCEEKLASKESKKKEKTRSKNPKMTMEKVSVGVMTSFLNIQSNVRRPSSTQLPRVSSEEDKYDDNSESEEDFNETFDDLRMQKEESLHMVGLEIQPKENNPSPPRSLQLDIQEYSSDFEGSSEDSYDSNNSSSAESGQQRIGWTFYDNFVGQVNSLLSNSQETPNISDSGNGVRNATLDQLKKLGVSFVDSDQKRVTFDPGYNPAAKQDSDTSMHINALAKKYLQTDQLGGGGDKAGANLSFATLKYLEKYRLVPGKTSPKEEQERKSKRKPRGKPKETKRKEDPFRRRKSEPKRTDKEPSKILDITAIKQQPKLLPKRVQSS